MIVFTEHPATPGSLESTPDLDVALKQGTDSHIQMIGKSLGGTILVNVEPPTPPRAVEVAYELIDGMHSLAAERRVLFMQSILEGAMETAEKQLQRPH